MKSFSKATPLEKSQKLYERWQELKNKREPWLSQWRSVSAYISPFSGRFDVHNHGQNRDLGYIFDSEASFDLDNLASGLMAGASSPARPWFKIAPTDPDLTENYEVINWCDNVQKILLKIFQDSNTYSTLHEIYRELALFGISADLIYDHFDTGIKHHLLTAGEFCVEANADGEIDTLYRNFELTTAQAVKAFGYEILPKEIQREYDRGALGTYWEFLHAIEPRLDRDYKKQTNENFEWGSFYLSIGTSKPEVIRERGFKYFPVIVPRWDVLGIDAYGTSPAIKCLPDIRQLQQETLRKAELIDLYTHPPIQIPSSARQQAISIAPNAKNFSQSTANEGMIKPIITSMGDLNALREDIASIKDSIKRAFFVDLFMMIQNTAGDRRTTVEIYALQQEQMLALGPVVERMQNECLGRLVNITYRRLLDANALPPLPEILQGQVLNVEFTSVLAQSQKSVDINSVDRLFSAIASAGQIIPEVFDRIDPDGYVDEYRDRLGVAPKILRSKEQAEEIRQQRAQAQQEQAQQAQDAQQAQQVEQLSVAQKNGADASLAMQQLDELGGGTLI